VEVEFKDADLFKRIMDTVDSLMADVSLDFNDNGLSIKAMDPANIAMIMFGGDKGLFNSFNVEKDTKLSVSLEDLNGILRLLKKEDKLKMTDSKNRLTLDIFGKNKLHFAIPLIDENYTAQKVPQLKFTAEATVLSGLLKEAIKAGFLVDDSIYFMIEGHRLILSSRSEEKEFSEDLSINENKEIFNIKAEALTRSKYSIEYLMKFLNPLDADKPVKIAFSNNYPLKLDYELGPNASMSFILANRLE
jgi:proliferating cell nuclear antigen